MSRLRWIVPLIVAAVFTPALATVWIGVHEGVDHADRFHHHGAAHTATAGVAEARPGGHQHDAHQHDAHQHDAHQHDAHHHGAQSAAHHRSGHHHPGSSQAGHHPASNDLAARHPGAPPGPAPADPSDLAASAPDAGDHHAHVAPDPSLEPAHRRGTADRAGTVAGAVATVTSPTGLSSGTGPASPRPAGQAGQGPPPSHLFTAHCALLL